MYSLRDKYAISGIGWTEFSKKSGRTVRSLASEACLKAIDDSGLKVADIDGFVSFNFNDSVPAISVATEIGVPAARYANDFLSGGNAANMIVLRPNFYSVVVVGESTSAFQLPSICFPHTTTYVAFSVLGFFFLSLIVIEKSPSSYA